MNASLNPKISASLVRLVRGVENAADWLAARPMQLSGDRKNGEKRWPAFTGAFITGDPQGCVAICSLTNGERLAQMASIPGVTIAGRLYTANLGIEKMIRNLLENTRIRFLVLCGKDSPFFQSGQAVQSLWSNGATPDGHIIGAQGHFPEIKGLSNTQIEVFHRQIELVNLIGETDPVQLAKTIEALMARNPGPFTGALDHDIGCIQSSDQNGQKVHVDEDSGFITIKPGGRREPLSMDPKGFYIISLDESLSEIVVRHYLADHQPAHMIRGRSGEAVLLGLLREGLVSQMSHAGYLGAELAKAETALRLNLRYEQDRPLR